MPIYAYRCGSCGHAKDVLQKLSDQVLSTCPACGTESFRKQVTAAGFQLKGSGWYVTDFRGGNGAAKPDAGTPAQPADGKSDGAASSGSTPAPAAASPSASTSTSSSGDGASGGGCGSACACH